MLLGCAFFVDVLKSAATLCKILQDNEVWSTKQLKAQ